MKAEDAAAIAAMEAEIFSCPWSEKSFLEAVKDKNACYLKAELAGKEGNTLAGYCGFWQSFEDADIMNVAVKEDLRGRSIAKSMLEKLMEYGKERGICSYTLEVRESNLPAIRLYEKLGFVQEGIRKNFYDRPKENALIFWKR